MTVQSRRAMTPQDITRIQFISDPQLSPDGRWVACVVTMLAEDQDEYLSNIWMVDTTGGEPRRFTTGPKRDIAPRWSPDGSRLAFVSERAPKQKAQLYVMPADGGEPTRLTDLRHGVAQPVWSEVALSRPERWRYERAGYTLDCWVMKPCGYEPGKRYPALLSIHGGPHTQYGHNFFDEFQVYAGAGYAVIYTNPRGSQGYGEAFTRAVHGDWGGGDYADVMAGLDEALRQCPFIDPERLGVMGGSYGGFLTSWIVGHTDRFKAACSERAVNNVYTFFGTSDIGTSFLEAQSGALPWDNMQWYIDHSPLTLCQKHHHTTAHYACGGRSALCGGAG